MEKELDLMEEYYESEIQPTYNKKLELIQNLKEQIKTFKRGRDQFDTDLLPELYEVNVSILKFQEMLKSLGEKYVLAMDYHDSLQTPLKMIYNGLDDVEQKFGFLLGLQVKDEDSVNKTLPSLEEKRKMVGFLTQLLESCEEFESNQEKIREIIGTDDYSPMEEGDINKFAELMAQKPELRLFRTKFIYARASIDEIIKKNRKFLQYAVPYMLLDMNDKFGRIENLGNKLTIMAAQWKQQFMELHTSKKDLRKKMENLAASYDSKNNFRKKLEILAASIDQKNNTLEMKDEL